LVDAVGGDGGRRGAGGVGEVAAGERALEQRPPLHRLRRWAAAGPVIAAAYVVVTSPTWAGPPERPERRWWERREGELLSSFSRFRHRRAIHRREKL
jgi:hypothetical protein